MPPIAAIGTANLKTPGSRVWQFLAFVFNLTSQTRGKKGGFFAPGKKTSHRKSANTDLDTPNSVLNGLRTLLIFSESERFSKSKEMAKVCLLR
jgi:hypothetical protein